MNRVKNDNTFSPISDVLFSNVTKYSHKSLSVYINIHIAFNI